LEEVMKEVGILLVGWFLGLLSPQIVEHISRRYRRPELMRSVAIELDELRFKLLTVRCNIRMSFGTLDREFVSWAGPRAKAYTGLLADQPARQHLIDFAGYTDKQLEAENATRDYPQRIPSFQKGSVPFLSSQLHQLSILPAAVQRHLVEILARLDYFNATVEKLHSNLMMTFDPELSPANRQIIQNNNQTWIAGLDNTALRLVDQIDLVTSRLGSSQSNLAIQPPADISGRRSEVGQQADARRG